MTLSRLILRGIGEALLLGCAAAGLLWLSALRYHPVFASDPWYSLPTWERGLVFWLILVVLDGAWMERRRPSSPLPLHYPLISEVGLLVKRWISARRRFQ
jgi:hypothetical protein